MKIRKRYALVVAALVTLIALVVAAATEVYDEYAQLQKEVSDDVIWVVGQTEVDTLRFALMLETTSLSRARNANQAKEVSNRFDVLTDEMVELLYKSAPLHDIGKIGIPDHILLKPGKLTPEEFEVMKTHTTLGRDAITAAEKNLDAPVSFLRYAREIAYGHQEKWDGSGYPEGLSADDIPLSARLMAVADVYDALISKRVYKPAFSHADAVELIGKGSARHFDPDIVEAFLEIAEEFKTIAQRYADGVGKT